MKLEELSAILTEHAKWVKVNGNGGKRADLTDANLTCAYLPGAYLPDANLTDANLARANLARANLADANLTGAYLTGANLAGANLARANLTDANLARANLARADLADANLTDANLTGANLTRADLADANLTRAYLTGANLTGAKGIAKYLTTPMYLLLDQIGPIRAYKLVNTSWQGPCYGGVTYLVGATVEALDADTDEMQQCAKGINLASLDWCIREWRDGYHILVCEFRSKDIAAIPIGSDGKFRVHRCKVIREKDLLELGLGGRAEACVRGI